MRFECLRSKTDRSNRDYYHFRLSKQLKIKRLRSTRSSCERIKLLRRARASIKPFYAEWLQEGFAFSVTYQVNNHFGYDRSNGNSKLVKTAGYIESLDLSLSNRWFVVWSCVQTPVHCLSTFSRLNDGMSSTTCFENSERNLRLCLDKTL